MGTTVLVSSNDDHLYAIDGATGTVRWRYRAENQIMSQPAYLGHLIYVGIGNAKATMYYPPHVSYVGDGMNKVEAIDGATGIESWWGGLDGTGMPSETLVGNTLVAADGNGTVLALSARDGTFRWDSQYDTTFSMTSVADGGDGHLYLTGRFENAVYALRAPDGKLVWEHRFSPFAGALGDEPLALTPNAIIGMYLVPLAPGQFGWSVTQMSRAQQHVFALEKRTGRLLWETTLVADTGAVPPYNQAAIPLVYRGRVYLGSAVAPYVTALDLHGRVLWQLRVRGAVKGGIAAENGVLYFGDHGGNLWAVDASSGRAVGHIATDMKFNTGSPIIVNASLVDGGTHDVIAVPLASIRNSQPVDGITRLSVWQRIGRFVSGLVPRRDPHREAAYYKKQ